MDEFGVPAKVGREFEATMLIVPQDDGFLVSGEFSGSIVLACGRCIEQFELPVEGAYDSFEEPGSGRRSAGGREPPAYASGPARV